MRHHVAGMVGVVAVCWGCARTQIASMAAPDVAGHPYNHVPVVFPVTDLANRQFVEDAFAVSNARYTPSYTVLFPGRQYTNAELGQAFATRGIDGVLLISLDQAGVTHATGSTSTSAWCYSYSSTGACTQASALTNSYDLSKPWARFTTQLYDVTTGKVMWIATSSTGGNAYANQHDVLTSMTKSTVERLNRDGIVPTVACDNVAKRSRC